MHNIKLELDFLEIGRKLVGNLLGIQNGALIFHLMRKVLFAYHLQRKTFEKFIFEKEQRNWITPCQEPLFLEGIPTCRNLYRLR